ncbi:MAG: Porin, partial [Rhizobacter sp.]|nr:Porin [Rhizobacter sp.]
IGSALPVQAQSMDEMRAELKSLRDELDELKKISAVRVAAPASGLGDRADAPAADSKAAAPSNSALPVAAGAGVAAGVAAGAVVGAGAGAGAVTVAPSPSLRIYGFAEIHAIHDLRQSGGPDVFSDLTYQPLDSDGGQRGRTQFTAETSRFGFKSSLPAGSGSLESTVEADFYSYSADNRNRVRLRHAYGEYEGWLIGQTWSTFMDLDDLPETVDFNGPIGAPFSRRPMIRYSYGDPKTVAKLTVAVESPQDLSGGSSANERSPQFVTRVDKIFDWGAVNARALTHEKRSSTQTKRGYGYAAGGSVKLSDKDTLMGQYTRVDGDVDQLYGSNGYSVDAASGAISFDRNQGVVLGYARIFSDRLRGNAVLGFNRGQTAAATDNRTLEQAFVNLIYAPFRGLELGGEYIFGQRKTFGGETGAMSRLDLMARYSF